MLTVESETTSLAIAPASRPVGCAGGNQGHRVPSVLGYRKGIDLGVTFGEFVIKNQSAKKKQK